MSKVEDGIMMPSLLQRQKRPATPKDGVSVEANSTAGHKTARTVLVMLLQLHSLRRWMQKTAPAAVARELRAMVPPATCSFAAWAMFGPANNPCKVSGKKLEAHKQTLAACVPQGSDK